MSRTAAVLVIVACFGFGMPTPASADIVAAGYAAHARGDYVRAARLLSRPAQHGNARAQALLGFMFANGQGVPQAYDAATYWYRLSAEQGNVTAQYLLGLMYDKGHGVPLDEITAYTWLNLATAGAPKRNREYYLRLRDAVASKMTHSQIIEGQRRSLEWAARPR
jgi:TPR repeat protein